MNKSILRTSVWLVNAILITLSIILFCLFSAYSYNAYSLNEVFLIEFLDTGMERYSESWMRHLKLILLTGVSLVSINIFWLARKILIHIRENGPFEPTTVKLTKNLLQWLIIYGVGKVLSLTIVEMLNGSLHITISTTGLTIIFLVSIIYVLIDIFKYGADIRSEQSLTI